MEKHKQFMAFSFNEHEGPGGLWGCVGSFDTLEEAAFAARSDLGFYKQVFDRLAGELVDLTPFGFKDESLGDPTDRTYSYQ